MSVVVLASDCESTWIVVRELQQTHEVSAVILEKPESRVKFIKRRIKRLGVVKVAGQILFQLATRLLRWEAADAREDIIESNNWDLTCPVDTVTHYVDSANSPDVPSLIKAYEPTVIVINGTRILGRKLLESISVPIINMHAGVTPKYRGVHGGYWALARGDSDNAGVTVHLVDTGIDTGDELYQTVFKQSEDDNFTTYPLRQLESGLPLLIRAVDDAVAGNLKPHAGRGASELFYHPTIWQYVWTRLIRKVR